MSQTVEKQPVEQVGFSFDKTDVRRIKARLDPLGETMTYIERLEAIARAAYAYYWNLDKSEDAALAMDDVHWVNEL
jgi:hypothetical protein